MIAASTAITPPLSAAKKEEKCAEKQNTSDCTGNSTCPYSTASVLALVVVAITTVVTRGSRSRAVAATAVACTAVAWVVRIVGMCLRAQTASSGAIGPPARLLDDERIDELGCTLAVSKTSQWQVYAMCSTRCTYQRRPAKSLP